MTAIAGRLRGVTVLVQAKPFLSSYICTVLADAQAVSDVSPLSGRAIAELAGRSKRLIACVEAEAIGEFDAMMALLKACGVPSLVLLGARWRDDPLETWRGPALRQPFAGYQIVEALESLPGMAA